MVVNYIHITFNRSILGPMLFILYIDDVQCVVNHSSIKIFADDISLYSQVLSYDGCVKLQNDLSKFNVYQWSIKWQVTLNPVADLEGFLWFLQKPPLETPF